MCRRFGALPSQILAEDALLLQMLSILDHAGGGQNGQ